MSTVAFPPSPSAGRTAVADGRGPTFPRVVRSEWTKLRSLRSTRWSLLAAVVMMILVAVAIAVAQMTRWDQLSAHDRLTFDSINTAVAGFNFSQLAIDVLGVLVVTGEYSTGMIRSSFMAVPHRLPVLWAKAVVFATITLVLMLVSAFVAVFIVQAVVTQHHLQHSLGDPHALRAVVGVALFLTVLGLLVIGLGALVRNTAGGIALFVFLLFVLSGITAILPASMADSISPYLPLNAGTAVATSTFKSSNHLAPWTGFLLFCGYTAVALVAAAIGLIRRDA